MSYSLSYADIIWKDDVPCSTQFDDIYFSRDGGVDETQHVFIHGNNLTSRFQTAKDSFTIIETGFGTGLNFLITADLWLKTAPKNSRLHFISTEKYPLSPADIKKALSFFPQFAELANSVLSQYPPACKGTHRIYIANGRITLTLLFGDINDTLPACEAKADAWFLDGFAPAKNESMWSESLYIEIARLSKLGTTIATYSAAGAVRRALAAVGFDVAKTRGFGHKRDMVTAIFNKEPPPSTKRDKTPWFDTSSKKGLINDKTAIVIGGGIAGGFAAASLAKRGFNIHLIERNESMCRETSGNPTGILQPAITAPDDLSGQYHLAGFLHSLNLLRSMKTAFQQTGALYFNLKREEKETVLPASLMQIIDNESASRLAGDDIHFKNKCYYLTDSCYLAPHGFVENVLAPFKEQIQTHFNTEALVLKKEGEHWQLFDKDGLKIASAPYVILASANDANQFEATNWLPLQAVRGQLTYLAATKKSKQLKTILCHETGYILPADEQGIHTIGATYEPFLDNKELLSESHERNIKGFNEALGENVSVDTESLEGRVSFRCTSPDRMPFIGPVPDASAFREDYSELHHGTMKPYGPSRYLDGLYLSVAHGSRGLSSAPLAAEIIASYITGEPMPIARPLLHAIHLARWPIRQLKKGKTFTSQ